jgi:hypothetical protein
MRTLHENPLDTGLTLADWATHDPDGYTETVAACMAADYVAMACEVVEGGGAWWKGEIERRMQAKLEKQVEDGAAWIDEWLRKFDQG